MGYYSIGSDEQEVTISYGRNDKVARIWTNDSTAYTKLDKLVKDNPNEWKCVKVNNTRSGEICSKEYECPKKYISFRSKSATRVMTEEQKKASAERLRKARENKKGN